MVDAGPSFTSAASGTLIQGVPGSVTVTTGGYPAPSLGWSGTIPAGLSFTDNGNGTATIAGTPSSAGVTGPHAAGHQHLRLHQPELHLDGQSLDGTGRR